jgi:hypothetical protein
MRKKEEKNEKKKVASRYVFSPFSPHQFLCFFISPFLPSLGLFYVPCWFTERLVSHVDCYSHRLPHAPDFPSTFSCHLAPSHSRPTRGLTFTARSQHSSLVRPHARPVPHRSARLTLDHPPHRDSTPHPLTTARSCMPPARKPDYLPPPPPPHVLMPFHQLVRHPKAWK